MLAFGFKTLISLEAMGLISNELRAHSVIGVIFSKIVNF